MSVDLNPAKTGLLIVDLQNDFLHEKGAYGRAGQTSDDILALPQRIKPVAEALRKAGGWIISAQFTLVPGKNGRPFIAEHLKKLRPFLGQGDFEPAGWGHQLVDELQPADFVIEKIAYSAFYMTRLEWALKRANIETLLVAGIVTNGGVASTVRDAHLRDIELIVLEDGCAAFSPDVHDNAIADLKTISHTMSCADALAKIQA